MTVVVLAPNWLGDAIMALPAIRDVHRHFHGQRVAVAARPSIAAVFRAAPEVDRIIVLERGNEVSSLRGDIGILLPNSFRSAWMLRQAGVKERWGYRTDFRSPLLTRRVRKPRGRVSFPEYYSNLVRQLGIETGPLTTQLRVPAATSTAALTLLEERGWQRGRPLVGIAPGAAFGHAKRWPPKRYAQLASMLTEAGVTCAILGRSDDRDAARDITGIDLIGQTDLMMLMGVVSHCHAVVSNDSGAMHVAGALGVPVVGIWGPTDERYSKPITPYEDAHTVTVISASAFCRPCYLADCPIDHRCMKRIATERVHDAVRQLLQESRA
ncbi:MAG TPA: lipopolysaccharide heptosyltransferase II [Vicinamibacterales bacterium]|nr:lipopolysaccharide heptosyltransferase II [Vicinamibacterales bacterium]